LRWKAPSNWLEPCAMARICEKHSRPTRRYVDRARGGLPPTRPDRIRTRLWDRWAER
jgi:hypothetical protein